MRSQSSTVLPNQHRFQAIQLQIPEAAEILVIEREAKVNDFERTLTWSISKLASGEQARIRFRSRVHAAGQVNFPVTISQDGREPQTISQTTVVK